MHKKQAVQSPEEQVDDLDVTSQQSQETEGPTPQEDVAAPTVRITERAVAEQPTGFIVPVPREPAPPANDIMPALKVSEPVEILEHVDVTEPVIEAAELRPVEIKGSGHKANELQQNIVQRESPDYTEQLERLADELRMLRETIDKVHTRSEASFVEFAKRLAEKIGQTAFVAAAADKIIAIARYLWRTLPW